MRVAQREHDVGHQPGQEQSEPPPPRCRTCARTRPACPWRCASTLRQRREADHHAGQGDAEHGPLALLLRGGVARHRGVVALVEQQERANMPAAARPRRDPRRTPPAARRRARAAAADRRARRSAQRRRRCSDGPTMTRAGQIGASPSDRRPSPAARPAAAPRRARLSTTMCSSSVCSPAPSTPEPVQRRHAHRAR